MIKLSAAVITHNEEKNISRCLEALHHVADEIVVLDSFSTDQTVEIARQRGARVEQHHFDGYIPQKNRALSMVSHDYVLSLDADEVLSPELIASIQRVKKGPTHRAYAMKRLNNFAGQWIRHCGWYPDKKVRLWHVDAGVWGGSEPHESVVLKKGVVTGFLDGDLLHYSYHSISHHMQKMNNYTTLSAKFEYGKGKRASLFRVLMAAPFSFVRDYIFKMGFRDGFYGLVICSNYSYSRYLKYVKLRALRKGKVI